MNRTRTESGFAYIAAVVLLVVVAGLAVALLRLTSTQQSTVDQALLGARAGLAARGGIEWGFRVLDTQCQGTPVDLTQFRSESGFNVTVTCSFRTYFEGERIKPPPPGGAPQQEAEAVAKRIYQITAVACNGAGTRCPDQQSAANAEYVERARMATVCVIPDATGTLQPCET